MSKNFNQDIIFQIPKFDESDQPKLDRSISEDNKKLQFKFYGYKNSILFPYLNNLDIPSQNSNKKSKKQDDKEYSILGVFKPSSSYEQILTPLNVMKASENKSSHQQEIQNSTTYEIKNTGNISSLSSKPLDDLLERNREQKSTNIDLKDEFHFQSTVETQKQGSKTSTMSVVHTEKTANENCMKFFTGTDMLQHVPSLDFSSPSDDSPFSQELFSKLAEVVDMMVTKEFISITKKDNVKWEILKPQILKMIIMFKKQNKPFVSPNKDILPEKHIQEDSPEFILHEILKDEIRPSLFVHGADVEMVSLDGFDLTLRLKGSYKNFSSVHESLGNFVMQNSSRWVAIKKINFVG